MTAQKVELYACESDGCPSVQHKDKTGKVINRHDPVEHEIYFFEENGVTYKVDICRVCEIHIFEVLDAEGFREEEEGKYV